VTTSGGHRRRPFDVNPLADWAIAAVVFGLLLVIVLFSQSGQPTG
jgi:hypothetical protein